MSIVTFHELLAKKRPLIVPCAHDGLSAKLIQQAGFDCCSIGGFALIASRFGMPDIGLASFGEIYAGVQDILPNLTVPLLVDADDGYGDVKNVTRTVRMYESLGVSGIVLEDQTSPKRCGHAAGKSVVPRETAMTKLRAALDARRSESFFIVARTDARGVHGLDEALERARLYQEAGADALFVEAPQNVEEMALIGRSFSKPLLTIIAEGTKTPTLNAAKLGELGFSMIWYPGMVLARMIMSIQRSLALIKAGHVDSPQDLPSVPQMSEMLGMSDWAELQERFG